MESVSDYSESTGLSSEEKQAVLKNKRMETGMTGSQ